MTPTLPPDSSATPGVARVTIDLADCTTKAELLARVALAFAFPPWFGHNWDALADCLTDLSWLPAPGYVIVITHARTLRRSEPETWATFREVLDEASAWWRDEGVDVRIIDCDEA